MSTTHTHNDFNGAKVEKEIDATTTLDHATANGKHMKARKPYDHGGNPLAHINTGDSIRLPAFGGEFQPGLYKSTADRKFANPAPLGLCAFALTTFILSLINLGTRSVPHPNLVVAAAYGYSGLVQLLAGMWEMAVGNTFGATALSSYGGFSIVEALTMPDGREIAFLDSFGFFLMGWFIFTTLLQICTLRSTVAFFLLFLTLDMAFLMLGIGYLHRPLGTPHTPLVRAGGAFGIVAAFLACFFVVPVAHLPWSDKGGEMRQKVNNDEARGLAEV
ncbi:Acetate permease A [Cryomyces minteri]|uniref:Acetate permease A n=1 Tax=Cryomyces minteri TaxID=331657 RepID=A0A4U0WP82_9PEZI|nr:Acetate permease A [Cryomyces minteri]